MNSAEDKKILWLCSWYPHKLNQYEGDFIQRHAKAVALLQPVEVICVIKDENKRVTKDTLTETNVNNNLAETIIYYSHKNTGLFFLDRIISQIIYRKIYKRFLKDYFKKNEKPSFVHVHIALKAGIIALWLKKKYNIRFILSEHWTGYLPEAIPNIDHLSVVKKRLLKKIFAGADKVTVVSKTLGEAIVKRGLIDYYTIVPNVVDTSIFHPSENEIPRTNIFTFIGTANHQKNIEQTLEAFALVRNQGFIFTLNFFAAITENLKRIIQKYKLEQQIVLHGEAPQINLAKALQQSAALILYSFYETFGCVVIEANACGIPAIVSDLSVFREYSIKNKTAFFVPLSAPEKLANTIINLITNKHSIPDRQIAEYVSSKFNFNTVAKEFLKVYNSLT